MAFIVIPVENNLTFLVAVKCRLADFTDSFKSYFSREFTAWNLLLTSSVNVLVVNRCLLTHIEVFLY